MTNLMSVCALFFEVYVANLGSQWIPISYTLIPSYPFLLDNCWCETGFFQRKAQACLWQKTSYKVAECTNHQAKKVLESKFSAQAKWL